MDNALNWGYDSPFTGGVPMQLPIRVRREPHVHAGHGCRDRQVVLVLLAGPSGLLAGAQQVVTQAQRPHGLRHAAAVGRGRRVAIRVQLLVLVRTRARVRVPLAAADRLRPVGIRRAVEVEIQPEVAIGLLSVHQLRIRHDGRGAPGDRRPRCDAALQVRGAAEVADRWAGVRGDRGVDTADISLVILVGHSARDVS